jgi:hypothetical protein
MSSCDREKERAKLAAIQGGEELRGSGVVAEGFAEVGKAIDVARSEDEAAAELQGIAAEFVLLMAGGAGVLAALEIVTADEVQDIGRGQVGGGVSLTLSVDQQREIDVRFLAEDAGVIGVAETDGCEGGAFVAKGLLMFAQLRDVLAAEDSAVMAKKGDHGGLVLPQRTETDFAAVCIRKHDVCKPRAESFAHAAHH